MSDLTLTEFLLARIAEDETDARSASRVRETQMGDGWEVRRGRHGLDGVVRSATHAEVAGVTVEAARHVARHDPSRVLAECEAKRRIVEHCADDLMNKHRDVSVLEFLALPYADHPDYAEAWRP